MTDLDRRDPNALGEEILRQAAAVRAFSGNKDKKLSEIVDHVDLNAVPLYDSRIGPVEKYGNPQKLHEERVANGTEPTL